ncbi:unnamed protein product [Gongylonema pulchrum]|uniref:WAT1-related protein n=1 Tax=Gongylonema pulchrum TaxID=637853 RepID=A0A183DYX7_9BILA|nr:unnamed protein product [Gongylonema pulchrum]VDN45059.1 unnamed protein product [Gongylonema pulchrum]
MKLEAIAEIHTKITALMAIYSACHVATKFIARNLIGQNVSRMPAAMFCYIFVPTTAMLCILHRGAAEASGKLPFFRRSKVLIFSIIEVNFG